MYIPVPQDCKLANLQTDGSHSSNAARLKILELQTILREQASEKKDNSLFLTGWRYCSDASGRET